MILRTGLIEYVDYVNLTIIWFYLFVNFGYSMLLLTSIPDIVNQFKTFRLNKVNAFLDSKILPTVTVLLAAYNEEEHVIYTVHSLLKSDYPNLEIIIINDGSSDETLPILIKLLDLHSGYPSVAERIPVQGRIKNFYFSKRYRKVSVIDKEHSGKADSLNAGINACTSPLFITVDADTFLERETIAILAFSMLSRAHTIAEGGSIYVLNGCDYHEGELIKAKISSKPFVAMQACEYLRAFVFGRTGWKPFRGSLVLSGCLTLFERQAVIEIGGFNKDSPGEDMEVIVNLHEYMRSKKYPYHIGYSFAGSAWTDVPSNMNSLWSQRDRWHRGLIDSLLRHKKMFFNPRYGASGLISYPFQVLIEFFGPIIETIGYISVLLAIYFGIIDWQVAILFFIATLGFSTVITLAVTLMSIITFNKYSRTRDILLLLFLVIFESFGYRQILTVCRVYASLRFFIQKIF